MTQYRDMRVVGVREFLNSAEESLFDCDSEALSGESELEVMNGTLRLGGFDVLEEQYPDLFTFLRLDMKKPADVRIELLMPVLKYQLGKRGSFRVMVLDGRIMKFSEKVLPYSLEDLCSRLTGMTDSEGILSLSKADHSSVALYAHGGGISKEPRPGDIVCCGLFMQADVVGRIFIAPFTFRMVCRNGAVHSAFWRGWTIAGHSLDRKRYEDWFDKVAKEWRGIAENVLGHISGLTGVDVSIRDANAFVRALASQLRIRLGERVTYALANHIERQAGGTAYDLWNAVTETLTRHAMSLQRDRQKYMALAGGVADIMADPASGWECRCCKTELARFTRHPAG